MEVQRVGVHIAHIAHSMELGESGAKPRDICAVLRNKMLFLRGVHVCTACKNASFARFLRHKMLLLQSVHVCTPWSNSFCTVLRHKNAILTGPTCLEE